jgi:hypothetical protein
MNACWAVKSIRRAEWNGGFRPDSGLSTRDPRRPALRPNEAFKATVCYVRSTSTPAVGCAPTTDILVLSSPSAGSQPGAPYKKGPLGSPSIAFVRKFAAAATATLLLAGFIRGSPRGCARAGRKCPSHPTASVAPLVRARLGVIGPIFRSHSRETTNGHGNDAAGAGSSSQIAI